MSEYPGREIGIGLSEAVGDGEQPSLLPALLRLPVAPALGILLAFLSFWALQLLPPSSLHRYGAALAGTSAWLYVAACPRMVPIMIAGNFAAVAGIFALAVSSMQFSVALPIAFALHAGWGWVIRSHLSLSAAWPAFHLGLALLLWLA